MSGRKYLFRKAVLFVAGCFFFASCENDINEVRDLSKKRIPVEEGKNIEGFLSQQAHMKAKLRAPVMKRYLTDSPYVEFPNSLHVDFYDDSLRIESQLNARYGRYKMNENRVFLRDSVIVFNTKGDTLHCRELWWDQALQRYYTDKPVRVTRPNGEVLYGDDGMQANQALTDIQFNLGSGKVHAPEQNF
jgi:LPS export ABC transporter protein LptC